MTSTTRLSLLREKMKSLQKETGMHAWQKSTIRMTKRNKLTERGREIMMLFMIDLFAVQVPLYGVVTADESLLTPGLGIGEMLRKKDV